MGKIERLDLVTIGYAPLAQIVGRYFNRNLIANGDLDEKLAHLAGNVRKNFVSIFKLDLIHRSGKNLGDNPGYLNRLILFFSHSFYLNLTII